MEPPNADFIPKDRNLFILEENLDEANYFLELIETHSVIKLKSTAVALRAMGEKIKTALDMTYEFANANVLSASDLKKLISRVNTLKNHIESPLLMKNMENLLNPTNEREISESFQSLLKFKIEKTLNALNNNLDQPKTVLDGFITISAESENNYDQSITITDDSITTSSENAASFPPPTILDDSITTSAEREEPPISYETSTSQLLSSSTPEELIDGKEVPQKTARRGGSGKADKYRINGVSLTEHMNQLPAEKRELLVNFLAKYYLYRSRKLPANPAEVEDKFKPIKQVQLAGIPLPRLLRQMSLQQLRNFQLAVNDYYYTYTYRTKEKQ